MYPASLGTLVAGRALLVIQADEAEQFITPSYGPAFDSPIDTNASCLCIFTLLITTTMEAVGFAASLLTLLSAAVSSAQAIDQFIKNLHDQPAPLAGLGLAVRELTTNLLYFRRFQNTWADRDFVTQNIDASFSHDLETLLSDCSRELSLIEERISKLQSHSTKNILQKGKKAFRLNLCEDEFDLAWKKIQLYTQQFALLLGRAGK